MAHNQVNEIDELLKDLKKTPGFKAYLILNSDGMSFDGIKQTMLLRVVVK